jgi:ribulose 1,5-bisphosphate carboxylase large subunit-like protein
MSSGHFSPPQWPEFFTWDSRFEVEDYLIATYQVSSLLPPWETAFGMAMEQSAATLHIEGYVVPQTLAPWTIRVRSCNTLPSAPVDAVVPYQLATEVYGSAAAKSGQYLIELAVPQRLLAGKSAQLMNVLVGELPRLGFLTSFRLVSAPLGDDLWPGPGFGIVGLRERLGVWQGPLLCRSMRPAVGLDLATMARLNHDVLRGGFHLVKDDELQVFIDTPAFETHVTAMVEARNRAMAHTQEKKAYLASLICEPDELEERWDICVRHGVDGVLVAPFVQGLGVVAQLSRRRILPLLAHNTGSDLLYRNTHWGIDESVMTDWLRHLGADWWVTPGPSGQDAATDAGLKSVLMAGCGKKSKLAAMMPILQGGKSPAGLPDYRQAVGHENFMLVIASWVDRFPLGLEAGAQAFRQACDQNVTLSYINPE